MPHLIEKSPTGSGFIVKNALTGHALEKEGIPLARAKAQIRAVLANEKPKEKPYPMNKIISYK